MFGKKIRIVRKIFLFSALYALSLIIALPAAYASSPTAKDLGVIVRALNFVENGPSGDVEMDIVYAPDNAASVEEAKGVERLIADGVESGKIKLTSRLVPIQSVSSINSRVVYLTTGTENAFNAVSAKRSLSVSINKECINAGLCVLAVETQGGDVEVYINNKAAQASGVNFKWAFRLMVTER